MNDGTLSPAAVVSVDNIRVETYSPEELSKNEASLIMALLIVCYKNSPYHFDYMIIRKSSLNRSTESLRYEASDNLVLKDICRDIKRQFGGTFGSVYVQMIDNETHEPVGIVFRHGYEKQQDRSFSIAYHLDSDEKTKLPCFIKQVYKALLSQMEDLIKNVELSENENN